MAEKTCLLNRKTIYTGKATVVMRSTIKKMYKAICGCRKTELCDVGDQLATWVFGFAQIFGHWPLTRHIRSNSRINSIGITVCDCSRLTVALIAHLIGKWYHIQSYFTISNSSSMRKIITISIMITQLSFITLNNLMSVWNRSDLLKLISINQEFDKKVRI